ncbi:aldehyde dehydrogenase [Penicillium longicatenatum]|nr:aldehyde dehydrogenase [Penicillium longicatenatum]
MPFQVAADDRNVVPLVVNGEPLPINESKLYPVVSARTNKTVHYYQSASTSDCCAACDAAWQAFSRGNDKNGPWKRVGVEERRRLLENVASLIIEREEALVKAQMEETSRGALWARMNVQITAKYSRELAACVWNAALHLCTRALAAAIGAGCTTVLKASELCPYTHTLIAEIFADAGAPPGLVNFVCSARDNAAKITKITENLIANKHIRKVDFIGSPSGGKVITATAAKHLKPVLLELGGKCPAIVLDDADLEKAAQKCAMGALIHHGQICFSTERIITFEGTPEFAGTAVSEQIARHAFDVLQDAKEKGLRFIVGDAAYKEDRLNSLIPAIVVVDVNMDANEVRIVDEETFGPSASLYIVNTDEEAIELANRSAFGLNATIHIQDLERGMRVGRELEYGQVHLNWETVYVTRELFSFTRSIVWN